MRVKTFHLDFLKFNAFQDRVLVWDLDEKPIAYNNADKPHMTGIDQVYIPVLTIYDPSWDSFPAFSVAWFDEDQSKDLEYLTLIIHFQLLSHSVIVHLFSFRCLMAKKWMWKMLLDWLAIFSLMRQLRLMDSSLATCSQRTRMEFFIPVRTTISSRIMRWKPCR
jgi:hypothetical protein